MFALRYSVLFAALLVAGALLPPSTQAQQTQGTNFCVLYQEVPQTRDLISSLGDEWDTDTDAWASVTRSIISYDGDDPTELLFQERGSSGAWRDTARAVATYGNSDHLTRCTFQSQKEGNFVDNFRINFNYDNSSRVDVEITQVWDTTDANPDGAWINLSRSTYSYNDNDDVSQRLDEAWDRDNEEWINTRRIQNEYDSSDRLTEELEEISDGSGGWMNSRRTTHSYGSNGVTETLVETWNFLASNWENDQRTQFSYPDGDTRVEVFQTWSSGWDNQQRTTFSLNDNDLAVSERTEEWDGSEWNNSTLSETTYTMHDGVQKIQRILDQNWDANAQDWENSERNTLSYTEVLPVELALFEAHADEEQVVLQWQTASEASNAGFDVQHRRTSTKGAWQTLGFVESKAEGGTTTEPQDYRFRTENLSPGTHSFRLRQVDLDGSPTLTDPVSVFVRMQNTLQFSAPAPNPVSEQTTLSFAAQHQTEVRLTLYNVLGQQVAVLYKGTPSAGEKQTVQLGTGTLASGTYILRLESEGQSITRRVTVVR